MGDVVIMANALQCLSWHNTMKIAQGSTPSTSHIIALGTLIWSGQFLYHSLHLVMCIYVRRGTDCVCRRGIVCRTCQCEAAPSVDNQALITDTGNTYRGPYAYAATDWKGYR